MQIPNNVRWIISTGVLCILLFVLLPLMLQHEGSSSQKVRSSPSTHDSPDNQENADVTPILAAPSSEPVLNEGSHLEPRGERQSLPPLDQRALEVHGRMVAGLHAKLRQAAKGFYAGAFRQLHLTADVEEKVLDILTQRQMQMEQELFAAAQSGTVPAPPSPAEARAQRAELNQQLNAVLGENGLTQFKQYCTTIPDRTVIDTLEQQDASLSASQSKQLLQILTDARQQIIVQNGMTRDWDSLSPNQAVSIMRQQQALFQQAVGNRVQNIITPDQARTLQTVLSQQRMSP
jgi:hypothetical protein